jgi:glycosyltransferase involved in cell wall biosynthesis
MPAIRPADGVVEVTVVMATHAGAEGLDQSLQSIFSQPDVQLECLLLADGRLDSGSETILDAWLAREPRLQLLRLPKAGLTQALMLGCRQARGEWIARLDVGDAMAPQRLPRQVQLMRAYPDCVLVTSDVEVCGPAWEPLWLYERPEPMAAPQRVDTVPSEQGIGLNIPHHASVLFRASAYRAAGGYRPAFYFGQDWDLWYRLADQGTFMHLPERLTRVRLFAKGISSRHWREQRAILQLALACNAARSRGESEQALLEQAAAIRPQPVPVQPPLFDGRRAEGAYLIAEALRRNRDRRCWPYFRQALRHGFWKPRVWVRALQALSLLGIRDA